MPLQTYARRSLTLATDRSLVKGTNASANVHSRSRAVLRTASITCRAAGWRVSAETARTSRTSQRTSSRTSTSPFARAVPPLSRQSTAKSVRWPGYASTAPVTWRDRIPGLPSSRRRAIVGYGVATVNEPSPLSSARATWAAAEPGASTEIRTWYQHSGVIATHRDPRSISHSSEATAKSISPSATACGMSWIFRIKTSMSSDGCRNAYRRSPSPTGMPRRWSTRVLSSHSRPLGSASLIMRGF